MNKARMSAIILSVVALASICHVVARFWIVEHRSERSSDVTLLNLRDVYAAEWFTAHIFGLLAITAVAAVVTMMKEANDELEERKRTS